MAEIARANHIQPILCSVLPANHIFWRPQVQPGERIDSLNHWLKRYAAKNHFLYLDYYDSLVDDKMGMKKEYSADGVHPNQAGYDVMERVALPAIQKLRSGKK